MAAPTDLAELSARAHHRIEALGMKRLGKKSVELDPSRLLAHSSLEVHQRAIVPFQFKADSLDWGKRVFLSHPLIT